MERQELEIKKIRERLQDEESRILFDAKLYSARNEDQEYYINVVRNMYRDWPAQKILEDHLLKSHKGIIVFGVGSGGRAIRRTLFFAGGGYQPVYFCDNYKAGEVIDGTKAVSFDDVVKNYKDYLIVIGTCTYGEEVYRQLVRGGIDEKNILQPKSELFSEFRGNQYFDVFLPKKEEIFLDAGSFDGQTAAGFLEWAGERGKKIYAFEPLEEMRDIIQKRRLPKTEILNYAVWDKKEQLFFTENSAGSFVNCDGTIEVQGMDIDSALQGAEVTFIKMDVEGSELKALAGARNTIRNYRPRLAICIYHKPSDVWEIPSYILRLVPEYRLYIRHYTMDVQETVLYAQL